MNYVFNWHVPTEKEEIIYYNTKFGEHAAIRGEVTQGHKITENSWTLEQTKKGDFVHILNYNIYYCNITV